MKVDLQRAVEEVERTLRTAESEIGPLIDTSSASFTEWRARHRTAMELCPSHLGEQLGAKINDRWDGCRVRIAGVSSTCTAGMHGALKNWLRAAKARLDNARAAQ